MSSSARPIQITRRLEFDAGHRIPDHRSQCRNLHGHRYALEITLEGVPVDVAGAPDRGMVMDFADVKRLALSHLVDHWDHAFLVYQDDVKVRDFLSTAFDDHKTVVLDRVPTVENLAAIAFDVLRPVYEGRYGESLRLVKLRLFETPTCWADVEAP